MTLRYLKLTLTAVALLAYPAVAAAEGSEAVTNLALDATLSQAGSLQVTEKIDYDFGSAAPHAITFAVPLTYHDDQGRDFRMAFTLDAAAQAAGIRAQVSPAQALITLPAGSGDAAARHYQFGYQLSPVVLIGQNADILKLNVTGLNWQVPINRAALKLNTPLAPADNLTCYSGAAGSTTGQCSVDQQGNTATVTSFATLAPGEGLSIFANFAPHSFANYLEPYEAHPSSPQRKLIELILGLIVLPVVLLIGLAAWLRRRYTKANETAKNQADRD